MTVLPGWKTPLEEMAGHDRLALRLIQDAEECRDLSHKSKVQRIAQAAVLLADRQSNPDVAEAMFQGLVDAVYEWHEWDHAIDSGREPQLSREQADEAVLWALAGCILGDPPCEICVSEHYTVFGIHKAELPSSLFCAQHRRLSHRNRPTVRGLLGRVTA